MLPSLPVVRPSLYVRPTKVAVGMVAVIWLSWRRSLQVWVRVTAAEDAPPDTEGGLESEPRRIDLFSGTS